MSKGVIILATIGILIAVAQASNASAGLILNSTLIQVNKSVGMNATASLQITNPDAFTFYNISFEPNPYISIPTIASLGTNATAIVTATVFTDQSVNASLRLQGFYSATVGQNPRVWQVNITQYTSIQQPCDFTITKGDSVTWTTDPSLLQNIELRQSPYQQGINTIGTLTANQSFTQPFSSPQSFKYRFYVGGFSPGDCTITVLDDNGAVNNPQYDAIATLQVLTNYQPTTVTTNVITSTYTMDFFGSQDGLMSVTNTGSQIAHNVQLGGDWFTFSSNNFDLAPGETKGLVFTIHPIVTQTNETNVTHIEPITVSGNFPTIENNISIFINYANLGTNLSNYADIDYLNNTFCKSYPNSIFCAGPTPQIIYKYVNNASAEEFNVTMSQEKLDQLWLFILSQGDEIKTLSNFVKQTDAATSSNISSLASDVSDLKNTTKQNHTDQQNTVSGIMTAVIIIGFGLATAIIGVGIYVYRQRSDMNKMRRMGL